MATKSRVEIGEGSIIIHELEIEDDRLAAFFAEADPDTLDGLASRALIIGALSLERATMAANVDYLRTEVNGLVTNMKTSVGNFGRDILAKVGTDDGQVLQPLQKTMDKVKEDVEKKLTKVEEFLKDDLDPDSKTSKVSKALDEIRKLLDVERTDSIQSRLNDAVSAATKKDGSLAKAVKEVVTEALTGVQQELHNLTLEVRGETSREEATQAAIEKTTLKGDPFENEVLEIVQAWGSVAGVEVLHVGVDNKPGDIQVNFGALASGGSPCSIIIETKDAGTAVGPKVIGDHMDERMAYRKCQGGVYIRKDDIQYAKGIGGYAEGTGQQGPWVAATKDAVITAIRHARVLVHLQTSSAGKGTVDVPGARKGLERIRQAIRQVNGITRTSNEIRTKANDIKSIAEALRSDIKSAISDVEDTLGIEHVPIDDDGEDVPAPAKATTTKQPPLNDGYAGLKR